MVKDMAFVAYSVADVPRARAFYRDTIGLRPSAGAESDHWVEFEVGAATFGIGNGSAIGIAPGSCASAAFEVDNLDRMRSDLQARGVTVSDVNETPVCFSCFVTDPEGNRFALHQAKPR